LLAAIGFGTIVLLDIASETAILVVHDLVILKGYTCQYREIFTAARVVQCLCTLGWIITLCFMVNQALYYDHACVTTCTNCSYTNDRACFTDPVCGLNGTCNDGMFCEYLGTGTCSLSYNATHEFGNWTNPPQHNNATSLNSTSCTDVTTREMCIVLHPAPIDCVLLGLVLLEATLNMIQLWFKSDIYPITLPEATMFTCLLHWSEKSVDVRHKLILEAVGKMEFGKEFNLDEHAEPTNEDEGPDVGEHSPLVGGGGTNYVALETS